MSRWFRMYDEVLDDPKAQRLDPALFKIWINMLCLASRRAGALPEVSDIAFALRLSDQDADKAVKQLVDHGLIDQTRSGLAPHNWGGRQYKSDVSTERVKRFRNGEHEKPKRLNGVSETPSESETDSEQSRTEQIDKYFAEFYLAYPRKQGKGQAIKSFRSALKKTTPGEIMAGLARYIAMKPDYADWAMPATWLNGERWLDEAPEKNGDPAAAAEAELYASLAK